MGVGLAVGVVRRPNANTETKIATRYRRWFRGRVPHPLIPVSDPRSRAPQPSSERRKGWEWMMPIDVALRVQDVDL